MPRKKKDNDYGTGIPKHEVEALARILLPEIQKYFESEEEQKNLRSGKHSKQNKKNKTAKAEAK